MPPGRLTHRFVALALLSGVVVAVPASTGLGAGPAGADPEPAVHESSVGVPDGRLADHQAHGFELTGGPELIAVSWTGGTAGDFEARALDGHGWGDWFELDGTDGPAPDAPATAAATSSTEPAFAGHDVQRVELRLVTGAPTGIRIQAVDSDPTAADVTAATEPGAAALPAASSTGSLTAQSLTAQSLTAQSLASPPTIHTRAEWGANEGMRRHDADCATAPDYVDNIQMGAVHHTAGTNDYSQGDVPGILRGIYAYHVNTKGWCDIAYNFFVDKFGTIWEGRYGGIYRSVISAATSGYNSYSTSVSMIGTYDDAHVVPPAAYNALVEVLAFKLGFAGVDPHGSSRVTTLSNTSARVAEGVPVTLPNIFGHRDSNNTDCPGNSLYARLPQLRNDVANLISSRGYTPGYRFNRLAGTDRYGTASILARTTFQNEADAFIARGDAFADALAANYAAGVLGAPVLLSTPGAIPQTTFDALSALHVSRVHLLGGTDALSPSLEGALQAKGYTVDRIAGATRYATAALIARHGGPVGTDGDRPTAVLSSGTNFPDALAAGGIVFAQHFPQLLTDGTSLTQETKDALSALGITHVLITGGTQAVSSAVDGQLQALGITSERISGNTRYETDLALVDLALSRYGFSSAHAELATGETFPDALTAGSHVGTRRSVMLLTPRRDLAPGAAGFLAAHHPGADSHVLGGTAAVDPLAKQQAEEAIDGI
jgi:putative cell wall-binding protein